MKRADILTDEQTQEIIAIIDRQCKGYKIFSDYGNDLFYRPYEKCRGQHSLTTAVISGFRPDTVIHGFRINELPYGLYIQPELISSRVVLHIYSGDNQLGTQTVLEHCEKFNADLSVKPIYAYIRFWADKNFDLRRIVLIVPNQNGEETEAFEIYKAHRV